MSQTTDQLTFVARHGERLYLNEDRTHDRFTLQLGAISEWGTTANKVVGAGVSVVQVLTMQGQRGSGNDVKYDITK